MADTTPLTPRPQVRSTDQKIGYAAPANVVNQGAGSRPAPDADLMGLVDGLQSFNPALNKFAQLQQEQDQRDIHQAEIRAKQAGEANAERDQSGLPLNQNPAPDAGFVGAFQSIYRTAYRQGIVERGAAEARATMVSEYGDAKNRPDFNLDQFIAQHRQVALQGLDNDMAGAMGKHLDSLEGSLRQDYDGIRLKRLDEMKESSISATMRNVLTPDDPAAIVQKYREQVLPVIQGMGKTQKEGAEYLFSHLKNLSDKAHGQPELFDALMTDKDPNTGMTMFDMNTGLQQHIERAKNMAQEQRDKFVSDAAQDGNLYWMKQADERIAKDPYSIGFDELAGNMGKAGVFKSDGEVMAYWRHILKARESNDGLASLASLARDGKLYLAPESDQKSVMTQLTNPVIAGLSQAISSGDVSGVSALTGTLIDAHRAAGATVGSEPIERMFKFIGTAAPSTDGKIAPIFSAASEVYRALEAKPELRNVYFSEDGRKVMQAYTQAVEGGSEPGAAYKAAYAAISPEAKAREEAFKKTPEFTDKLTKATKWVTGSSFWPRILGGNGRPENGGQLVSDAQTFALDYVKRNPSATDDDVQKATADWTAKSFVMDKNTGIAIRVPQKDAQGNSYSPEVVQQSVEAYTKKLIEENKLKDLGSDWNIAMIPTNINQGTYQVSTSFNGHPVHLLADVKIGDIIDQHRKDTLWLPQDAAVLKEAQLAMSSGQAYTNPALAGAVAKARQLGVQPDLVKQIGDQQITAAQHTLSALPRTNFDVDTNSLYKNDRIQNSPTMTVGSAQRLLNTSNGGSTGLAASLITMGEGVMLSAYDDPARGAGKNIGMGYNLEANKATAERDLRSAGVPAERIPGVIAGTAKLAPEQAERLTMVTVGRYDALARGQVNALQPGLYERLQPQQRAVLTDIAYQTGNVGQFKKAIGSLVSGDTQAFQDQSKVFYTNRNGQRVEDKRRNALRNAMLSGTNYWQAVLQRSGAQPSNQIDAVNLASQ